MNADFFFLNADERWFELIYADFFSRIILKENQRNQRNISVYQRFKKGNQRQSAFKKKKSAVTSV